MLISDIVRRVRDSAGDSAVLQFSNSTITDWINDAIRECVIENSLLQGRGVTNTVAAQREYSLPSDIFKIHSVWVNNRKLQMQTLEEFEAYSVDQSYSASEVTHCYVYAGILSLYPVPDAAYELVVNYTKTPANVTYIEAQTAWSPNQPPIPDAFHNRIVTYCLAQVAMQDDDYPKYQMLMQEFKTGVVDLKHMKDQEEDLYPFMSVSVRDQGDWYE